MEEAGGGRTRGERASESAQVHQRTEKEGGKNVRRKGSSLFSHLSHTQMFGEETSSRRRIRERTGEQRRSKKPPLRKRRRIGERQVTQRKKNRG